jgi:transposase
VLDAQQRIAELEVVVAAKDAQIVVLKEQVATLMATVAALTKQVAELTEKLAQNSRNSHLPPSSDPPGSAGKPGHGGKPKSARRRGGQRGHRGTRRTLVPQEQVNEIVDLYPAECENCWKALPEIPDTHAKRYQVTEVPPILPHTTEVRRHAVACPCCGHKTRAAYDENVIPASPFGPRLMSIVALLTGAYHVSRRKTATLLSDLVGVPISLGAISAVEARVADAVKPAVDEAWTRVEGASVKHTDGTSWLKAGTLLALWTIATAAATVFKIVTDGSRATLEPLYCLIAVPSRCTARYAASSSAIAPRPWGSGRWSAARSAGHTCCARPCPSASATARAPRSVATS